MRAPSMKASTSACFTRMTRPKRYAASSPCTTVTAVASDLAQRAANEGPALTDARFDAYVVEARRRLGRYGDDADFRFALVDADADGTDDTVSVTVDASLPILLPVRWSGYSPAEFSRTMRARLEVFQEAPA